MGEQQKEFELRKDAVLKVLASDEKDKSRKGGVDAPIAVLIARINSHPSFFTTSSCSGRVSVFLEHSDGRIGDDEVESSGEQSVSTRGKKGGDWIYVSHEPAHVEDVLLAVREKYQDAKHEGSLVFRFEPFILALECASLAAAQQLVTCAMASGYRESGLSSMGKRIIVAVRSSIRLEVPIGEKGQLMVPEEYLSYLTAAANKKFVLNQQRIDRFLATFVEQVDYQIAQRVDTATVGSKSRLRTQKGISSEGQDKLLSSLAKRQSNILVKINLLEGQTKSGLGCSVGRAASCSTGSPKFHDMCSLCAVNSIASGPLLETQRWGHSACAISDHALLIFGGYGGHERHARLNDLLLLDIKKGTMCSVRATGTPPPMMAHTALKVADSMVVIGGRQSPTCILDTVRVLDLRTMEWHIPEIFGAKFPPRHRHAAAVVGSKVYLYGGLGGSQILGDMYMLDTASWTWSLVDCPMKSPSARHSHAVAAVNNKLYLFGGREGNTVYGDLHVFDIEKCVWTEPKVDGIPPSRRFSHTMTAVGQYIAVLGGCPITKQESDVVLLDVAKMAWVRLEVSLPRDRLLVRHSTTLVDDALVVVGGGAACFAFGTHFSPTFVLSLRPLLHNITRSEPKHQAVTSLLVEPRELREFGKAESPSWVLKVEKGKAKVIKDALKELKWLDLSRKARSLDQGAFVGFPILEIGVPFLVEDRFVEWVGPFSQTSAMSGEGNKYRKDAILGTLRGVQGEVLQLEMLSDNRHDRSPLSVLQKAVAMLLERDNLPLSLLDELPKRWERLGDMVLLPAGSLCSPSWSLLGEQLWRTVALSLNAARLARQAPIASKETRDSRVKLLYGRDGWVEHRENGILYCFDVTKCMFSSGNVSEKLRVASMPCQGATVVDLFAGIGYYVLPFLLKAGAQKVYACEWNPSAIRALRYNLHINGVEDKCEVIEGDNRTNAPQGVADIVSLGLLPSSEGSWPAAVRALKLEGGKLLVHENVKDTEEKAWVEHLLESISSLSASLGREWDISVVHVERVKWYAPHIRHVVAEVCCKASS